MDDQKIKFESKTTALFNRMASQYDSRISRFYFEPLYKKLIEIIEGEHLIHRQSRVLDVACGTGEVLARLARAYPESQFVGIDASPQMVAEAKRKTEGTATTSFVLGGVESMPFEKESFDLVISSEAFHHFWNPEQTLREIFRVLRGEGRFLLADPGADTFLGKLIFRYLGPIFEIQKHVYDQTELGKLLEGAGFNIERVFSYRLNNFIVAKKKKPIFGNRV